MSVQFQRGDLELLLEICATGNLGKAAARLHLHHATAFRKLADLERRTGLGGQPRLGGPAGGRHLGLGAPDELVQAVDAARAPQLPLLEEPATGPQVVVEVGVDRLGQHDLVPVGHGLDAGGGVDDGAAVLHDRGDGLDTEEAADLVDPHDLHELVEGGVDEGVEAQDAGVVDQSVDATEVLKNAIERCDDVALIRNVGHVVSGLGAGL